MDSDSADSVDLAALLHKTFGFSAFRTNQEAVCRAATDGRDVLLVMPTGAGKSLCYQLPALARGGTALVISPLIALMDDQAAKLSALGLRVARIHSGLSREESRQACRDYLDGTLQFLFIAPERMRVPGFPEMLAKKKPALIAIDEAHCISQWGHDFRPDYRTLGDYLPALRPAPVIALTATATPTVQKDIVAQLHLSQPALFIHGFRRHNLAIEVVEMSKPRRNEFTAKLLKSPSNRPAIVYAPSRKAAEELASVLGGSAAAYHAGLEPSVRERVQRHFLSGKLDIVVATIAFGMGIDKADVRTVVHTALPGSVEAYYQEIGRAGRDGKPSRTVLLHSYADRKMHDFFLERDYPATGELARLAAALNSEFQMPDLLRQRLRMDAETFDRTAEKLASQGAAAFDMAGNIRSTGQTNWRSGYDTQLAFRRSQIDSMVAFAETPQCRMSALVQHFGDTADGLRPCGRCDFCSPERAAAQTFRPPTAQENRQLRSILEALDSGMAKATGKLHGDLALGIDRKQFDSYLDALTRAGLIAVTADAFTNSEGTLIHFKRASLTHEGRTLSGSDSLNALLKDIETQKSTRGTSKPRRSEKKATSQKTDSTAAYTPEQKDLDARLRDWRKAEAAGNGRPSFLVLTDATLSNVVFARPTSIAQLLDVSGIGQEKADRFGAAICAICDSRTAPGEYGAPAASHSAATEPKLSTKSPTRVVRTEDTPSSDETFHRQRATTTAPAESLTAEQQQLDQRLRDWRKDASEAMGIPQFFILGSSTLRSIVLTRPRNIAQLRSITGLGPEKVEKYGTSICEICNA
ncbi:MAG: recombinase RecQ [Acidobacteriales bacterium 59-55]|nr:RecQ family ATP-dependent DNA helicase [Terriglobales bacterium]OJV41679.1 MAG: recombinase RecQ [Acidobacteriales bacterium 59-55]